MSDVVIRVEGLGKKYWLGANAGPSYKTVRESLIDAGKGPLRKLAGVAGKGPKDGERGHRPEFWALKDVSFEVKRGEVLGIIGRNGAGKSTLLKILSQITEPTEGEVSMRGRVASLLEVGTGFHPELTGRENVYLNGAILGMGKAEIARKFDEIVAFAEVEKFIDTPVKRYSSGMYLRLAFSVAAHLEPEILVVDEVLAVGDTEFQRRCLGKVGEVVRHGRTVLLVSHHMGAIMQLSHQVLWLQGGSLVGKGSANDTVADYLATDASESGQKTWAQGVSNPGVSEMKILSVSVRNSRNSVSSRLDSREPISIEITYLVAGRLLQCRVGFQLVTADGIVVFEAYDADDPKFAGPRLPGRYTAVCSLPGHLLSPGSYMVSVNAGMPNVKNLALLESVLRLTVEDMTPGTSPVHEKRPGVIRPQLVWQSRRENHGP